MSVLDTALVVVCLISLSVGFIRGAVKTVFTVLGIALSAAHSGPVEGRRGYGVFRM